MQAQNLKEMICKDTFDAYCKLLTFSDGAKSKVKCSVCNVYVINQEIHVLEHVKSKQHTEIFNHKNKMDAYCKQLEFTDNTKKQCRCKFCNVILPYIEQNIIQHMEGNKHKDMVDLKNKVNGYCKQLQYTDNTKSHTKCIICDVNVPYVDKNIIQHFKGRSHKSEQKRLHKQKMNAYFKLLRFTDSKKEVVNCIICGINVPNTEQNIIEHMGGTVHTQALNNLLDYHNIIVRKESEGYYCDCCKIPISNFFSHINSKRHMDRYLVEYVIDKRLVKKYVYDDDVKKNEAIKYRELYRNLLKYNEIEKLSDTSFYCGICDLDLNRVCEIYHVLGINHRSIKEEREEEEMDQDETEEVDDETDEEMDGEDDETSEDEY